MKRISGFMLVWLYFAICWVINVTQLLDCSFDPIGKETVVHIIGLLGPCAGITVWY